MNTILVMCASKIMRMHHDKYLMHSFEINMDQQDNYLLPYTYPENMMDIFPDILVAKYLSKRRH